MEIKTFSVVFLGSRGDQLFIARASSHTPPGARSRSASHRSRIIEWRAESSHFYIILLLLLIKNGMLHFKGDLTCLFFTQVDNFVASQWNVRFPLHSFTLIGSTQLYLPWSWSFCVIIEYYLNVGGAVIARQPKTQLMSLYATQDYVCRSKTLIHCCLVLNMAGLKEMLSRLFTDMTLWPISGLQSGDVALEVQTGTMTKWKTP